MKRLIKHILNFFGIHISRYVREERLIQKLDLYSKYKDYTMVPEMVFNANLELCLRYKHKLGNLDFIECGVWRGGMSAAFAEILGKGSTIHLFDSFEGLPPAKDVDGDEAKNWQADVSGLTYFDNCKANESFSIKAMSLANHDKFKIHKGWFENTVKEYSGEPIGILRLDGDWYDSIYVCLEYLYPHIVEGGMILIDDYYVWDGCSKAVHDYLSKVNSPSRIRQFKDSTVVYIIKKSS